MIAKANIGPTDRIVRIVIGAVLVALPFTTASPLWDSPIARWATILAGTVLVATALVRFCPLYRLVGASTCKSG